MKRLPMLIEVLLVLLLAWFVTGWVSAKNGAAIGHSEMQSVNDSRDMLDLKLILNVPLFGEAEKNKPVVPKKSHKAVSSSRLNIKLLGTVVAGKKSAAVVMMQGSKEQKVLFLGSSIQPGVVLEKVMAEEAIFNRNGKLERVMLQKNRHQAATSLLPVAPPPTVVTSPSVAVPPNHSKMRDGRFHRARK